MAVPVRPPRRFYLAQSLLLAITGALLLWLFHATRLDLRLEARYYDAVNHTFPWRYAWVTKYLVHRYLKYALLVAGLGVWLVALRGRLTGRWPRVLYGRHRRWWLVAWSFVAVPVLVGILHRTSAMHCPWEVIEFGGQAPYFDLLSAAPAGMRAGHCFPAAFVSSGSWLLSLALLWYPERRLRSFAIGVITLAFTFGLGWVQQMRGAHFLSHTLWTLWISWATIVLLHAACGAWKETGPGAFG